MFFISLEVQAHEYAVFVSIAGNSTLTIPTATFSESTIAQKSQSPNNP